jgi:hypothetical protein
MSDFDDHEAKNSQWRAGSITVEPPGWLAGSPRVQPSQSHLVHTSSESRNIVRNDQKIIRNRNQSINNDI